MYEAIGLIGSFSEKLSSDYRKSGTERPLVLFIRSKRTLIVGSVV